MDGWNFKFTNFVIGGFASTASSSDATVAAYSQAGFNTIMVGRYMYPPGDVDYSFPSDVEAQMDLALKYGLGAIIDGFTRDINPWGGQDFTLSNGDPTGSQHPISFDEFKWLQADLGSHPALVGYFLRDDVAGVDEEWMGLPGSDTNMSLIADYMRTNCPQLFPWISWVQALPASGSILYQMRIPTSSDETYPYGGDSLTCGGSKKADYVASYYCQKYFGDSRALQMYGCPYWPMFSLLDSDSLLRFPAYAAVAYGAKGIWYYTYVSGGGSYWLQNGGPWLDADEVTSNEVTTNLTEVYPVAQVVNNQIASWSPWVLANG